MTSACGGTGVTTVAIHLASALSSGSVPSCYLDVDPNLGGAARLGMPEDVRTFDPADRLLTVPHSGGFRAIFAPDHPKAAIAGRSRTFPTTVDRCFPWQTSKPSSIHAPEWWSSFLRPFPELRARALFLERHGSGAWVIVGNRIGPGGETSRTELSRILGRRYDVMLPCSALLRDREDVGALLTTPLSRWKRAFDRLAEWLTRWMTTSSSSLPIGLTWWNSTRLQDGSRCAHLSPSGVMVRWATTYVRWPITSMVTDHSAT